MSTRTAFLATLLVLAVALPARAQRADWAKAAGDHHEQARTLKTSTGETLRAVEGWIAVPERRDTLSRLIEIHYLRLIGRAPQPKAPLVYLAGGPGNLGTTDEPHALTFWNPFLGVSDVVLLDQRGTR